MIETKNSLFDKLKGKRVILASGSSSRQDIFKRAGFPIETFVSGFPENLSHDSFSTPEDYCTSTAIGKLEAVIAQNIAADLIVTADTVIVVDNCILEKPKDREDAYKTLMNYSEKTIKVITAVAFQVNQKVKESFCDVSLIKMHKINDEMINSYMEEGHWESAAGSLRVEGYGMLFIDTIQGNYDSILGFPMAKFYQKLMKHL